MLKVGCSEKAPPEPKTKERELPAGVPKTKEHSSKKKKKKRSSSKERKKRKHTDVVEDQVRFSCSSQFEVWFYSICLTTLKHFVAYFIAISWFSWYMLVFKKYLSRGLIPLQLLKASRKSQRRKQELKIEKAMMESTLSQKSISSLLNLLSKNTDQ